MHGRLGRQAKILSPGQQRRLVAMAGQSGFPNRDQVMVLLGIRAGLRASEIAKLTWCMVLDANGAVATAVDIRSQIAKRGSGRRVPMHPQLRAALSRLRRVTPPDLRHPECPVLQSRKGGALRPNSVVNWFKAAFRAQGLEGCSSHSLRRTFVTSAARTAHRAGASLRDVQMLAGHRSIETTQGYIEGNTIAQQRLVRGL